MATMKMPGYDKYTERLASESAARDAAATATRIEQERIATEAAQKAQAEKIHNAKYAIIKEHLKPEFIKERAREYGQHMARLALVTGAMWMLASIGWLAEIYCNGKSDPSYKKMMGQMFAFRDAFNPDATEEDRTAGRVVSILNYAAICAIMVIFESWVRKRRVFSAREQWHVDTKYLLELADKLKCAGIVQSNAEYVHQQCGELIISKLSAQDRGYIENLLSGGLNNANFETAVAIIEGHLKSHPDDYAEIISIIDEATLPRDIVEKYGAGKTVSFVAAHAMQNKTL